MYFTICAVLLLILCQSHGQEISQKQCEKYINQIGSVLIQKAIPKPARPRRHIVGGTKSAPMEFPFMAALGYGDDDNVQWECGGSLISEKFVLTAAHCATHRELGPIKIIRLGTTLLTDLKTAQDIAVKTIQIHPQYSPPSTYNDIALVEMSKTAHFSSTVLPACLNTDYRLINVPLIAIGWGRLDFAGDKSDDLMKVTLSFTSPQDCKKAYASESSRKLNNGIQSDIQICANGGRNRSKDTCQGDSGGPLLMRSGNIPMIVGITSFGKACGIANTPGVYTRVSTFVPWLESIVWLYT